LNSHWCSMPRSRRKQSGKLQGILSSIQSIIGFFGTLAA
jgi:hypothetical protein